MDELVRLVDELAAFGHGGAGGNASVKLEMDDGALSWMVYIGGQDGYSGYAERPTLNEAVDAAKAFLAPHLSLKARMPET